MREMFRENIRKAFLIVGLVIINNFYGMTICICLHLCISICRKQAQETTNSDRMSIGKVQLWRNNEIYGYVALQNALQ